MVSRPAGNGTGVGSVAAEITPFGPPSFDAVYAAHFPFVARSLRRLGVPPSDLADAAQEVFVVVHGRLPRFEGNGSLRAWLYRIARNVAIHGHRGRARRARKVRALAATAPAVAVADLAATDLVHDLLQHLSAPQRDAFILVRMEGLTAREVARDEGVAESTIHSRVQAARRQLQAALTDRTAGGST